MAETNGTIHVTFKQRVTNRDALNRSIVYEWLKPPASVELLTVEANSFFIFARLVTVIQTADGLPFDPAQVRQDKAAALAAYNAYLDMDESVTNRLEDERDRFYTVTDPALLPAPLDKDKKTAPENAAAG